MKIDISKVAKDTLRFYKLRKGLKERPMEIEPVTEKLLFNTVKRTVEARPTVRRVRAVKALLEAAERVVALRIDPAEVLREYSQLKEELFTGSFDFSNTLETGEFEK